MKAAMMILLMISTSLNVFFTYQFYIKPNVPPPSISQRVDANVQNSTVATQENSTALNDKNNTKEVKNIEQENKDVTNTSTESKPESKNESQQATNIKNKGQDTSRGKGSIKGVITWQYNDFVGTKGDVGAVIILIPADFNKSSLSEKDIILLSLGITPKNCDIYTTKADGYGNYQINNLPENDYVLLVISRKTFRNLNEPIPQYTLNKLKSLLGVSNSDNGLMTSLKLYNSILKEVKITEGEEYQFSNDFGYTY
ncbi:hypothetical protein DFP93_1023 [Aneurinibacillus soli]|uniref:Uncharacterized protein n=1 Tax=Aneurinibacillus soli TaxID=1500254 RepID=A0A0U5B830_9BACL|nr:hypothetical protein [Aneurinibacillus soli]PYE63319.1 hypothetical protein DFP93_1023 [Aneurinibacillus soli]BAU27750.1 hypothetical protein CB4_01924 [Aneurinibacillus soli]